MPTLLTIPSLEPVEFKILSQEPIIQKCYTFCSVLSSLTERVARLVVRFVEPHCSDGFCDEIVEVIMGLSSIVNRNDGEWHIHELSRLWYLNKLIQGRDVDLAGFHQFVMDGIVNRARREKWDTPLYLSGEAGNAYHVTFLNLDYGLSLYEGICRVACMSPIYGWVWHASKLAQIQQVLGIIPDDSILPAALRGIVCHKEKQYEKAAVFLEKVRKQHSHDKSDYKWAFANNALRLEEYSK